jgi:hypothetical protein
MSRPVSDPLADLTEVIRLLAETGSPAATRIAEALAAWRDGSDCLEEALGAAPGLRAAWHRRQWDRALLALAQRCPTARSASALAAAVHNTVDRYETGPWLRDQAAGRRPDGGQVSVPPRERDERRCGPRTNRRSGSKPAYEQPG